MADPGGLAAGITILVLIFMGVLAAILTKFSRRQHTKQGDHAEAEAQLRTLPKRTASKPPQLPKFTTKSSLSMSTSPISTSPRSPRTPRTPGIRFTITTPSHRSRTSGSIDSLPSVETVLDRYEREADAAERHDESKGAKMLSEEELGEPGPSVPTEERHEKRSAWDRPQLGLLREASESQEAFGSSR
ncbi:hypothetical protein PMZ80_005855 [Knufia obscura]|uniref:Uncharacterized protein n=2 Tax=Knufia TaxID=430999 RepID=A0AAN8EMT8_9EURO|nr:hypothetical protein PMZ80_005855 [Knufia obscura]KAK5954522.1 hypothetical protein OHC33_004244 [Knufia fluminis]